MSDPLTPGESPLERRMLKHAEYLDPTFNVESEAAALLREAVSELSRLRAALASTQQGPITMPPYDTEEFIDQGGDSVVKAESTPSPTTCPFICVTCERWLSDAAELRQHQGWKHQILETAFLHGATPPPTTEPRIEELKARVERAGWAHPPGSLHVVYVNDVLDWLDELVSARATSAPEEK